MKNQKRRSPMSALIKISIILLWIFLIFSVFSLTNAYSNIKSDYNGANSSKLIRIDGDIIFGGIFPMHEQVIIIII